MYKTVETQDEQAEKVPYTTPLVPYGLDTGKLPIIS